MDPATIYDRALLYIVSSSPWSRWRLVVVALLVCFISMIVGTVICKSVIRTSAADCRQRQGQHGYSYWQTDSGHVCDRPEFVLNPN